MLDKFEELEKRLLELEKAIADPKVISDTAQYQKAAKEMGQISPVVNLYRDFKKIEAQLVELEQILKDKNHERDFLELAKSEIPHLKEKQEALKTALEKSLLKEEAHAGADIIFEIRAGVGGLESSIFAADLYRMYTKYALKMGWKVEPLSSHPTEAGGFKEIVFSVAGKDAYRRMKFESGVHRVQRVPDTEASGRIHTSTVTVAIMVEPEEVELKIDPKDLKIDIYRSSGPGGQSVNTADSAVRITHLPSGIVVTCQDERSQLKNKNKAMRVLKARILDKMQQEKANKVSEERKSQIGSGDRSEKIRTYNFPDRRVTDHRIGLTIHRLESVMEGNIDEIIDGLLAEEANRK
ncbi:MAG: peptide chain release factor 1 [Candidatus Omnitrophota bacterium]|nr:peptide chain release factor 1 [Candidatus Omnitrophota bacterium]